ncbi:diaminopimelate decarboxylase [bacterium]|nr:diaminopimelate decarboxylase [bacterium]
MSAPSNILPRSATYLNGVLHFGGCSAHELIAQYGSPLYVIDKATIDAQVLALSSAFGPVNHELIFAGKSCLNLGIAHLMNQHGLSIDVVSLGELHTALVAGIHPSKLVFHGNNKSQHELETAIQHGIRIIVDNAHELDNISAIAKSQDAVASILLRINPEIEAHTHEFIQTGQKTSKFGFDQAQLLPLVQRVSQNSQLNFLGIHSHLGSQIFDPAPFKALAQLMTLWVTRIHTQLGITVQQLNLGGGFGIRYTDADHPTDIQAILMPMIQTVSTLSQAGIPMPKLLIEPGRFIMGRSGVTLYRVGAIKQAGDVQYLFVDGGMADNSRPLIYGAKHHVALVKEPSPNAGTHCYSIAGKFCESGDKLAEHIALPPVGIGDYLAMCSTGAYTYSMASNYNRYCKPAMVLVDADRSAVLVQRETLDAIMAHDQFPLQWT